MRIMSVIRQRQPSMPKNMEYPEPQDVPLRTSRVTSACNLPIQQTIHDICRNINLYAPSSGSEEAVGRQALTNQPG
jgi:hypothetical protein